MRTRILQLTGLPVCVGIGSTIMLTKLANHCAKKQAQFNGVCDFNALTTNELNNLISKIGVGEVWGVGRKLAPKLQAIGINSGLDLKQANADLLRRQFDAKDHS